ncbi:Uu.00g146680.m01.CDS01 [Anthostomella pinea]|uniref:Uu.00g146680.m01.CDS01 n=1 Tax=Anthostomella pinea TaxID=933095 RepID=A0AAI8VSG0_9PEZI|nr:Uu.00g146680.m01.CDS01 [Anthostomella pinea]
MSEKDSNAMDSPFLTTGKRLKFRALTTLLQHTNACCGSDPDPAAPWSRPEPTPETETCKRSRCLGAFAELLLSLTHSHRYTHIRAARSTPRDQGQQDEAEDAFGDHCFQLHARLQEVFKHEAYVPQYYPNPKRLEVLERFFAHDPAWDARHFKIIHEFVNDHLECGDPAGRRPSQTGPPGTILDKGLSQLRDEELASRVQELSIARVSRYVRLLGIVWRAIPNALSADICRLHSVYAVTESNGLPAHSRALRGGEETQIANAPWPPRGHHLHAEAAALDTSTGYPQRFWHDCARSYIRLILAQDMSFETLTSTPDTSRTIPAERYARHVREIQRVQPISCKKPPPALAGTMQPLLQTISTLPGHLHTPLLSYIQDRDDVGSLTDRSGFTGSCHPEMQFAALQYLAQEREKHPSRHEYPDLYAAHLPPRAVTNLFRARLREMPTTQRSCPFCMLALSGCETTVGEDGEKKGIRWDVPPARSPWYEACDLPSWLPRRVGDEMIRIAEKRLRQRAEFLYERERSGGAVDDAGDVNVGAGKGKGKGNGKGVAGKGGDIVIIFEED